jgi:hypothetical protein
MFDEGSILRRTIVGVVNIGARSCSHIERVVLIFDRHYDAVQRNDEFAVLLEITILRGGGFERVRHFGIRVCGVGQAAGLALVKAPFHARGGTQVQRRQRIDLLRVWNGCDRSENAGWLTDAYTVVGLDAIQVQVDDGAGRGLCREDGALDIRDAGFFEVKRFWRRCLRIRDDRSESQCEQQDKTERI